MQLPAWPWPHPSLKSRLQAFADSVSSQKRAAADGECREECLLQETASKEAAMATRIEEVQAELKQARLALSNADAEIDRLGVFSTQLKKVSGVTDYILVSSVAVSCNMAPPPIIPNVRLTSY